MKRHGTRYHNDDTRAGFSPRFRPRTAARTLLAGLCLAVLGCAAPQVTPTPDTLYQDGERLFQAGKYQDAVAQWKKVKEGFHSADLSARAEMGIADAYFKNKDYLEAAIAYEDFRKLHPTHARAGHALFRQGLSNFNQITGIDTDQTPLTNALTLFESYRRLYPKGDNAAEAAARIADCRDKQLQYELYVGSFYLRTDRFPAAIARFEQALLTFSEQPRRDELLLKLGRAYFEAGQAEKGRQTLERLASEFPNSLFRADAEKLKAKFR